jgi:glycosyltransferase involved in cell wall biosynthesis
MRYEMDVPQPHRISVISQLDPASARTNSIADFRLCSGLAAQGHIVELVVPAFANPRPTTKQLFATYDLQPNFKVRYLSATADNGRRVSGAVLSTLWHHIRGALRPNFAAVVISREARLLLPYLAVARLSTHAVVTAPWLHEFRGNRLERLACAHSTCILATNSAILRDLSRQGVNRRPTFVTGNPAPLERVEFGRTCSRVAARRHLKLDPQRPVIAYTGKLYLGMRELDYILQAASRLPDCLFLFTGGKPPVIEALRRDLHQRGATNVQFAGILGKPEEARFYQQAANVLVSYYSIEDHPYARHNLPNKIAEYMATGNAVVAADFPAVRDLLNEENAILVKPDDVGALTEGLAFALRRPHEAAILAAVAQRDIGARTTEAIGAELSRFLALASSPSGGR